MFFNKKKKEIDEVPVPPSLSPNDTEEMLSESLKDVEEMNLPPMPDDLNDIEELKPIKSNKKVAKKKLTKSKSSKTKVLKSKTSKPKVSKKKSNKIEDETELMLEKSFDDPTIREEDEISIDKLDSDLKGIEKSIAMTESALKKIDADLSKINKKMR